MLEKTQSEEEAQIIGPTGPGFQFGESVLEKSKAGTLELTDELIAGVVTWGDYIKLKVPLGELNEAFHKYKIYLEPEKNRLALKFKMYVG